MLRETKHLARGVLIMAIVRKATGKRVARVARPGDIQLVLLTLPAGVYGIENADGNEVAVVAVKAGRVKFVNGAL